MFRFSLYTVKLTEFPVMPIFYDLLIICSIKYKFVLSLNTVKGFNVINWFYATVSGKKIIPYMLEVSYMVLTYLVFLNDNGFYGSCSKLRSLIPKITNIFLRGRNIHYLGDTSARFACPTRHGLRPR